MNLQEEKERRDSLQKIHDRERSLNNLREKSRKREAAAEHFATSGIEPPTIKSLDKYVDEAIKEQEGIGKSPKRNRLTRINTEIDCSYYVDLFDYNEEI